MQIGRWTATAELGRGRLGPLYLVRSGEELACARQLDAGSLARPGVRDAVTVAARSLGAVRHPGVIPVLDIVDAPGALYVITAYAPGPGLRTLLTPSAEVPGWAPDAVSAVLVLGDVADAVLGLHAARLAHGALAASAVVIGYDGVARICDSSLLAAMTGTPLDPEADRRAWADIARTVARAWVPAGDPVGDDITRAADAAAPFDGRRGDLAGAAAQLARRSSGPQAEAGRAPLRAAAGDWAAQRAVAPSAPAATPEGTATLLDFGDVPAPSVAPVGGASGPGAGGASSPVPGSLGGGMAMAGPGLAPAPPVVAGPVGTPTVYEQSSWSPPGGGPAQAPTAGQSVVGTPTVFDVETTGPAPVGTPTVYDLPGEGTTWRDGPPVGTPTVHDLPGEGTTWRDGPPVGTPTVYDRPGDPTTWRDAPPAGPPSHAGTPTLIDVPVGTPTVIDRFPDADTPYRLGVAAPTAPPAQQAPPATMPGAGGSPVAPAAYPGAPQSAGSPAAAGPVWFSVAPPPPKRGGGLLWLLGGALAFLAVAATGAFVLLGRSSSGPALSVTGIVAVAQPAKAGCDSDVHVSGTITTNGGKGTIDYQWFRDGQPVSADILHMPVDKDQTQVHLPDLTLTNTGKGSLTARVTLTVISPAGSVPGTTSFAYSC